jgi:PAS domain S-box-containing protein
VKHIPRGDYMKNSKIVIIYLLLSMGWILVTDYVVKLLVHSEDQLLYIGNLKGIFYVLLSGIFFYYALNKAQELKKTKETEQRLSTLINSMVDFVNFKDGDGRWIETNEFGLKLFQLENVDYRGKKDSELAEYSDFYREALIYCEESDEDTWKSGTTTRCEEVIPMPDGSHKIFDTIKVPLYFDNGQRKGLVVIGRDITEQKLTEEQLRKSEKLSIVGELAASVAHEIRNPLTSLKGFVQMFQAETKDERHMLHYDIMINELNRINHIVSELLILAKPQKISFSVHSVNHILKDVISLLETQANMNNVNINYMEIDEFQIACSENQLKQLFINIIKNAIEASSEQDIIKVSLHRENQDEILISVEDKGIGISEEFLTRIGEPFYSSKEKGTGLGLTVSTKIVEQHKGKIVFHSKKNVGTKVEITLPIRNALLSE